MDILPKINSPADVRKLERTDLHTLVKELREDLLATVSQVGGHLAPSLGVVELTVALHHLLDMPDDQIVWDVGHQAYIHKMLTGRRDKLGTIRKYGGISGFCKRTESPYDAFGAGHATTSISAAWGIQQGLWQTRKAGRVVPIIGDGALTGGMAYEALNNAGAAQKPFLVILNDNDMSISPNVGAVSNYLTSITSSNLYQGFRKELRVFLDSIPKLGHGMSELARRFESSAKTLVTPGALFEALGFEYFGPIDGHDLDLVINVLDHLLDKERPTLLHLNTVKGKGYEPAEKDSLKYHGVTTFDLSSGEFAKKAAAPVPSYSAVFGEHCVKLAKKDKNVVAITAAMPTGTGLQGFQKELPEQFYDVGIAESHGVTFAAGLATTPVRPITAIYSTFLQRAFDQIVHDIAIQHLPVILCLDRGGLAGADGPTHHGALDLAYLRLIPDMVVAAPKDGNELGDLLKTAVDHLSGPMAIRYPREDAWAYDPEREPQALPMGSWEVLRDASDKEHPVALLAVGAMVRRAVEVAEELASQGIHVTVVNARFIKPLDEALIEKLAQSHDGFITVEDGTSVGGFGSGVCEFLNAKGLTHPLKIVGLPDRFVTHGGREDLFKEIGLDSASLVKTVGAFHQDIEKINRKRPVPFPVEG